MSDKNLNDIPDISNDSNQSNSTQSYIKKDENEGKKLFANEQANKALKIAAVVIGVMILAMVIFVYAF